MKIIALSGKMGTGKDYIGRRIQDYLHASKYKVCMLAFADFLKLKCYISTDFDYKMLTSNKTTESRTYLQELGDTERKRDPNVFIRALDFNIKMAKDRNYDFVVITDLRFINELEYLITNNAVVVRIEAPKRNEKRLLAEKSNGKHSSETELDKYEFDHIMNNDPQYGDDIDLSIKKIVDKLVIDLISNP